MMTLFSYSSKVMMSFIYIFRDVCGFFISCYCCFMPAGTVITPGRRQSKTSMLSTNVDQKSLETEFSIGICRPTGDKWQSKTLFLAIFDPGSSIVKSAFHCHLPGVVMLTWVVIP